MSKSKKIIGVIVLAFVLIQFIRIDKSVPEFDKSKDFIAITQPPVEVANILKNACYDCHSYNTKYKWYAEIAPVSFFIKYHINEGRDELNFSLWGDYAQNKSDHKLEASVEHVEEGEMPLWSYRIAHPEAQLSNAQKEQLMSWFKSLR